MAGASILETVRAAGRIARDEAIERGRKNAREEWKDAARLVIRGVASTRSTFTTDDVWAVLDGEGVTTHDGRAMGGLILAASRKGVCSPTDMTRPTTRAGAHLRPVRVWTSLIFHTGEVEEKGLVVSITPEVRACISNVAALVRHQGNRTSRNPLIYPFLKWADQIAKKP